MLSDRQRETLRQIRYELYGLCAPDLGLDAICWDLDALLDEDTLERAAIGTQRAEVRAGHEHLRRLRERAT